MGSLGNFDEYNIVMSKILVPHEVSVKRDDVTFGKLE